MTKVLEQVSGVTIAFERMGQACTKNQHFINYIGGIILIVIETIIIRNKAFEYDFLYLVSLKIRILSVEERKYTIEIDVQ